MSEVTSIDIFRFVTDVFSDSGSLELQNALAEIMEITENKTNPKEIVRSYSVVVELLQRFCLEQIKLNMSGLRHTSVSQLNDASIVAQGGT